MKHVVSKHLGVHSELLYLVILCLGHVAAVPVLGQHTQHLLLAKLSSLKTKHLRKGKKSGKCSRETKC